MTTVTVASLHPVYECMNFLERNYRKQEEVYGVVAYDALYESLSKKHLFDEKQLRKKIKAAMALQKKVIKAVKITQEEQDFYFSQFESYECSIAKDLCYAYIDYKTTDLTMLREQALSLMDAYGHRPFQMICCSDDITMENPEAFEEDFDFIGYLRKRQDLSSDDKWRMIEVSADVRYHFLHLLELMEPGIRILQDEIEKYQDILTAFQDYVQTIVKKEQALGHPIAIQTFCYDAYFAQDQRQEDITIIPSIAELNAIGWLKRSLIEADSSIYIIGVLMDDSYHRDKHLSAKEDLLQGLKILSDNSKFEILKELRKHTMYGQEIADKLKLSKATVSHHMNALSSANFITIREEKKKIYYTMNEDYIRNMLSRIEEELLGK